MIIKNGFVFQEDKTFIQKDLYINSSKIVASLSEASDDKIIDADGMLILPGLIDIHSHGAVGHDFSDADIDGLKEILKYEYQHGITSYCPTSMTMEKEQLRKIFNTVKDWRDEKGFSHLAGINMEGPFIDPIKKGAHREECIILPNIAFFKECNIICGGKIRLVTIAPNTNGAMQFICSLKNDVVISLGHTSTDYKTARLALETGASHITHLFNGMSPFEHRNPGLIGAAAEDNNCMAELICDGIHVHESMIRAAFKLFPERIVLISDSIRATGMKNGTYDLGGQKVTVNEKLATLYDKTIAGSVTNLFDCMCRAIEFGIPLEESIAAATINPAKSIGIYNETGSLTPGKRADIIITDQKLNLIHVI